MLRQSFGIFLVISSVFAGVAQATTIQVTLNTSALVADTADQPFSLEFELDNGYLISSNLPGGPHTNASNIVTLSNFNFGGGFGLDPATDPAFLTDGGASGDIRSVVSLLANRPGNYFSQGFTPGSQLTFNVTYTNNVADADILDSFDFAILDSQYYELPTQGGDIFDSFLQIDFDSDEPTITTFASDPTFPTSAGELLTIDAPLVTAPTAAPEPGTFGILALGALLLVLWRVKDRVRQVLPLVALAFSLLFTAFGPGRAMAAEQQPEFFTGTYQGHQITYQIINGFAVIEGDMIIGEASAQTAPDGRRTASLRGFIIRTNSNSVNIASSLWPKVGGVVTIPYTITKGGTQFMPAINAFNSLFSGQINWTPRTNQRNYVDINLDNQSSNSCYATRGFTGGKEVIQGVAAGCGLSANLHEMGHVMGFSHEQSRQNRNSYIAIDFSNIAPSSQSQYNQDFSDSMDLGLYDYSSLMHYGPRGFSRNGNPEMESIPVGIPFGDPPTFSLEDIDALNRLYFTAPSKVTVTSLPAGLQIVVDGATYTAPQSFSWALGSTHTLNVPTGPQTVGASSYIFGRWNSDLTADLNPSRTITIAPGTGMLGSPASAPLYTVYQANYIQLAQYNPTPVLDNFTSTTTAAGSISANPAPVAYPGLSGQYFVNRKLVTLTATPAAGNSYYGLETTGGQTFGPATNPVTLPSDLLTGNLYVDFASSPQVTVTTNITNNNASGTRVTADGAGSKPLPAAWSSGYDSGWSANTTHSLTAATPVNPVFDPNTVYTFTGWSDGVTSATRTVTVPATGVVSLGVNYSTSYHVTANVNTACGGTVSVSPVPPANGFFLSGTPLTFTATPTAPFVFAGWGGTLSGSTNPLNTAVNAEVVGTANFNLINAPLTITSISPSSLPVGSPAQSITISGTGFTPANTGFYLTNNYLSRTVTYVNANTISVALLASDLATAGAFATDVQNYQGSCGLDVSGPSFLVTP